MCRNWRFQVFREFDWYLWLFPFTFEHAVKQLLWWYSILLSVFKRIAYALSGENVCMEKHWNCGVSSCNAISNYTFMTVLSVAVALQEIILSALFYTDSNKRSDSFICLFKTVVKVLYAWKVCETWPFYGYWKLPLKVAGRRCLSSRIIANQRIFLHFAVTGAFQKPVAALNFKWLSPAWRDVM